VESTQVQGRPLTEERRRHRRYVLLMHVTAVRRGASAYSHKPQVVSLLVYDISDGGVGVLTPEAFGTDEELTLFIPPRGGRGGRDVRCQVTRCEEHESRFRIGLMFRDPLNEAVNRLH